MGRNTLRFCVLRVKKRTHLDTFPQTELSSTPDPDVVYVDIMYRKMKYNEHEYFTLNIHTYGEVIRLLNISGRNRIRVGSQENISRAGPLLQ